VSKYVQEAIEIVKKNSMRFDGRRISYEELMAYSLLLRESSNVVAEYAFAGVEKTKADKTRITAKTMFGLKGSATREEGRRLARERHEQNQAEKAGKAARKEDAKLKKALEVAAGVTRGAELLRELEVYGERLLSKLVIPDLQALLTNADPQGNVTKPKNKKRRYG
jgi:hypothetical protein